MATPISTEAVVARAMVRSRKRPSGTTGSTATRASTYTAAATTTRPATTSSAETGETQSNWLPARLTHTSSRLTPATMSVAPV